MPVDLRIALFSSLLHVQNTPHLLVVIIVILVIILIISACPHPKVTAGKRQEAVNYEKDLCILSDHFSIDPRSKLIIPELIHVLN